MENKKPTGLSYANGLEEYNKFQFDRISPVVEVFHILPDGSEALNLIPKGNLKALFKNLNKIASLQVQKRPLIFIGSEKYRLNRFTGLGTDTSNGKDYITIYLEDLDGQSYKFLWIPEMVSNS